MKNASLKEAVIAITYRCNSRCKMCNIWQITEHSGELKPENFNFLPSSVKEINITGGEPFLRKDLKEIIKVLIKDHPDRKIIISSNGFATELIIDQARQLKGLKADIGIAISIDGIGGVHENIRGIEGGYEKVLNTIKRLKGLGIKKLKIAFTIADYNLEQLPRVYELARSLGVELTLAAVHSSDNYFSKDNHIKDVQKIASQLDWLTEKELSSFSPKKWARAYFTYGLKRFLLEGKRILPDYSGKRSIFIDPQGNIYPSDVSSKVIGNIRQSDIDLETDIKAEDNPASWMICTARQSIKAHKITAISWIVSNKARNMLFNTGYRALNVFWYFAGLAIAILNRLRHLVLDYRTPRPISPKKIKENTEYVAKVAAGFEKKLKSEFGSEFDFKDKNILEIGPGQDLGTGIVFMSKQANSYTAVDRFKLLVPNPAFYSQLMKALENKSPELEELVEIINSATLNKANKEIRLNKFKYINTTSETMSEKLTDKFDLIVSQAVLEHVEDIGKAFKEMYKLLGEGGVICHEIDFKAHTTLVRESDPLNILRFGRTVYNLIKFRGSPNRLRLSDYVSIAKEAGFRDVRVINILSLPLYEAEMLRKHLARPFRSYGIEDLAVLEAVLIAKK